MLEFCFGKMSLFFLFGIAHKATAYFLCALLRCRCMFLNCGVCFFLQSCRLKCVAYALSSPRIARMNVFRVYIYVVYGDWRQVATRKKKKHTMQNTMKNTYTMKTSRDNKSTWVDNEWTNAASNTNADQETSKHWQQQQQRQSHRQTIKWTVFLS